MVLPTFLIQETLFDPTAIASWMKAPTSIPRFSGDGIPPKMGLALGAPVGLERRRRSPAPVPGLGPSTPTRD